MKQLLLLLSTLLLFSCNQVETKTTSDSTNEIEQWLTFKGKPNMPKIVLVSGDEEYRSEEALPQLAKILATHHGFNTTVLFAQDPKFPGIVNPNYTQNIPGLEKLAKADLMIIFTRFRALPDDQMKHIDAYLKSGKPVLGMRTSTHAFKFKDVDVKTSYAHYGNYAEVKNAWNGGFGRLVMGEHWIAHHGDHGSQSTHGLIAPEAANHPILNGIENGDVWGPTDVYRVRLPLPGDSETLLLGQVTDREKDLNEKDPSLGMQPTDKKLPADRNDKAGKSYNQNKPMMPIAWTKSYLTGPEGKPGKCFATTMGASTDLLSEGTRRLLVNATYWLLGLKIPSRAQVDIVGTYQPTRFEFKPTELAGGKEGYWENKNRLITTFK